MEPAIDMVMNRNPEELYIKNPTTDSLSRNDAKAFAEKLNFLEFANSVSNMLENYEGLFFSGADLKYRSNWKQVKSHLIYYKYLLGIYRNIGGVVMNSNYARAGENVFKLLMLPSADLKKLSTSKANGQYKDLGKMIELMANAKESMEQSGFRFGRDKYDKLMSKAEKEASDYLEQKGLTANYGVG